jgi:hypothetical protein
LDDFWEKILYLDHPEPYNGDAIACRGHFSPGDPQCCSDVVYALILKGWVDVRARTFVAVSVAEAMVHAWRIARDKFRPLRRAVDDAYHRGEIDNNQRVALQNFINRVLEAWDNFIDHAIENYRKCMVAGLKYIAGIICLGCDPHWDRYLYEGLDGHIHLKLTTETCNQIRGGCLPFWQLIFQLIQDLEDALDKLFLELNLAPVTHADNQICDGDCGDWLCRVFFNGKDTPTSAPPGPDDNHGNTTKRVADRVESLFTRLEEQVTRIYHPHETGPQFAESFSNLLWTTHSAVKAFERAHRRADTYQNEYGTDGYEPLTVGEKSGLDTSVDSASSLSSWLHFFLYFFF